MALKQALRLAFDEEAWPAAPRSDGLMPYLEALLPAKCQPESQALVQASVAVVENLDAQGRQLAAQGLENAYHNREHVMDVLQALRWLLAQKGHGLNTHQQMLLTLAMIAHDYGHNGGINQQPFELEQHSFALVRPFLEKAAVSARCQARIRRLIYLTDPACQSWVHNLRPGIFTTQVHLAVEADLLASLMPARGFYLGARLAAEQMGQGVPKAAALATLGGRLRFLSAVRFCSEAAACLGLDDLRRVQIACISEYFADQLDETWSAALGQAYSVCVQKSVARLA